MSESWLYALQRGTALLLAPLLLIHLLVMLYAVEGGLSAAEILGRTQGSAFWAIFYGLLVLAASIHGPIGLRAVLRDWTGWSRGGIDRAMLAVSLLLLALGMRAVAAVTL